MNTLELDYITVNGFKSIASVERLELRPINVIIGPNGSGKSNFIGVFSFLHEIREGRLNDYVRKSGGAENILHFISRKLFLSGNLMRVLTRIGPFIPLNMPILQVTDVVE